MARVDYSQRDMGGNVLTGLAPGVASTDAATVGQLAAGSPNLPWVRLSAAGRALLNATWTQFTSISIDGQSGGFSGSSNIAVPAAGAYQVNYRVSSTVAGRLIVATANTGDGQHGATPAWHFDTRATTANDFIAGTRLLPVTTYLQFWVYTTPASTVAMFAEAYRVGA